MRLKDSSFFYFVFLFCTGFAVLYFSTGSPVYHEFSKASSSPPQICQPVFQSCNSNSDCCTGACENNQCIRPNNAINCGLAGEISTDPSRCCSQVSYNNICIGSPNFPAINGAFCINSWECQSQNCFMQRCQPSSLQAGHVGQRCLANDDCYSRNCFNGMCLGSKFERAPYGAVCLNSYECASQNCFQQSCR